VPPTTQGHTLTHLTPTSSAPASTHVAHAYTEHAGVGVPHVAHVDRVRPEHTETRLDHVARANTEHAGADVTYVANAHRVRAADAGATFHLADSGLGV
jgi:hypothetical protein